MKKYFLALLFINTTHASVEDIDITPLIAKYADANPVQSLPATIDPIKYDIPESKWEKVKPRTYPGRCKDPVALFEVCESPQQRRYQLLLAELKKQHKEKHGKDTRNDRLRNPVNSHKCNSADNRCSKI
jgi:hypothetical protein